MDRLYLNSRLKCLSFVLIALLLWANPVNAYRNKVEYLVCDIGSALTDSKININNYRQIVDALINKLHCNGIKVHMDYAVKDPEQYSNNYFGIFNHALKSNMIILAEPSDSHRMLGKHKHLLNQKGKIDDQKYADWVLAYANYFAPQLLNVFNDIQLKGKRYKSMVDKIRQGGLDRRVALMGLGRPNIVETIKLLDDAKLKKKLDFIGSRASGPNSDATQKNWKRLIKKAGKIKVWSTDNGASWSDTSGDAEKGIRAAVDAGVFGIVLKDAYPAYVKDDGGLTDKGVAIAEAVGKP